MPSLLLITPLVQSMGYHQNLSTLVGKMEQVVQIFQMEVNANLAFVLTECVVIRLAMATATDAMLLVLLEPAQT